MPTVTVQFDQQQIDQFAGNLRAPLRGLPKELAAAVNESTKRAAAQISKLIRDQINIRAADLDPRLKIQPAAESLTPQATISIPRQRIPLKYFGAKQVPGGVAYRIAKANGGRVALHAFGPDIGALGGNVFRRVGRGRTPIVKLYGPSPWGVLMKGDAFDQQVTTSETEMETAAQRRMVVLFAPYSQPGGSP